VSASPSHGPALIEVKGLRKDYPLKSRFVQAQRCFSAVKGADFSLHKGRTLGVVGESGSGKTTVGMMLTRLTDATAGSIMFEGTDLATLSASPDAAPTAAASRSSFQNPYASLNPRFTIGQILMEPHAYPQHRQGRRPSAPARAVALIEKVGLPPEAFGKYPHAVFRRPAPTDCHCALPDHEARDHRLRRKRQRAGCAACRPRCSTLLLDLQEEFGLTYVFISHDLAVVKYMADDILVMNQGEIVERGSSDDIYNRPQHAYTRQLLGASTQGAGRALSRDEVFSNTGLILNSGRSRCVQDLVDW